MALRLKDRSRAEHRRDSNRPAEHWLLAAVDADVRQIATEHSPP